MTIEDLPALPEGEIEAAAPPKDADLKNVRDHAAALWKKRREVDKLLAEAKALADEIEVLETKVIPDAMAKIGMTRFELTGGFEVSVEKGVTGSITKEHKAAAHEFLEKNNYGSLIKRVITIEFGMGEEKWAAKFLRDLAARKRPLKFDRTDAVHAGTLKKFVRERIEAENAGTVPPEKKLPRDLFGVYEYVRAVLIDPAEKAVAGAKDKKKAKKGEEVEM